MTAKQKAAREKFKAIIQEAKKLRAKNPKLTQAQAVKQAWAIEKRKKPGKIADVIVTYPSKKEAEYKMMRLKDGTFRGNQRISAVPKKTSKNYHKDSKSHNVNIRVVSGIYDKEKEIKGWTAVFSRLQGELLNERDKREKAKIRKEIAIAKTIISNLKKSKI